MELLAVMSAMAVLLYGICYEPHAIQQKEISKKNKNTY
jgi:hypothetical protein